MKNVQTKVIVVITAIGLMVGVTFPVFAAQEEANPWTKLERGAINSSTGWLELAVQPVEGAHTDSPFLGTVVGFGKGILLGLQRTGLGLADSLSFPMGPYDRPAMEPETLFSSK